MTLALRATPTWTRMGLYALLLTLALGSAAVRANASSRTLRIVRVGRGPSVVVVARRAGRVFVGNHDDATVSVLEAVSGAVRATIALGHYPIAAAVDERHGRVFFLNTDDRDALYGPGSPGSVSVLDARSGRLLQTTLVGHGPGALAVDAVTGRVVVTNRGDQTVSVLDGTHGKLVRTVAIIGTPGAVALDGWTGRAVVTSSGDGSSDVSVLDIRTGAVLRTMRLGSIATDAVASVCTRRILVSTDRGLELLDARTGRVQRTVRETAIPLVADERSGRVLVMTDAGLRLLDGQTAVPRSRTVPWSVFGGTGGSSPTAVVDAMTGQIVVVAAPFAAPFAAPGTGGDAGRAVVLDGYTGTVLRTVFIAARPGALAVDAQTHQAFVAEAGATGGVNPVRLVLNRVRQWAPWLPPMPAPVTDTDSISVLVGVTAPDQTTSAGAPISQSPCPMWARDSDSAT